MDKEITPRIYDHLEEPLAALLAAAEETLGVVVVTDNVDLCKARLHTAKKRFVEQHPQIAELTVRTSAENAQTEVLIVKSDLKAALENKGGQESSQGPKEESVAGRRSTDLQIPNYPPKGADD